MFINLDERLAQVEWEIPHVSRQKQLTNDVLGAKITWINGWDSELNIQQNNNNLFGNMTSIECCVKFDDHLYMHIKWVERLILSVMLIFYVKFHLQSTKKLWLPFSRPPTGVQPSFVEISYHKTGNLPSSRHWRDKGQFMNDENILKKWAQAT